ncbi:NOP protein chaperone 1 [Brachyistius frenatus]|uniref:NOP protein chaperone 1 n=1 Tax=Brachyistius frenatus TaxID=100188 RepID=UPI0037E99B28
MEVKVKKRTSQDLLSCGRGPGLREKLLLQLKDGRSLQTERVPQSSVLQRLQSFLPQMAEANEKLQQQMEEAPAGHFDIERVEDSDRVVEMDVALVELDGSDSDSEEEEEEEEEEEKEEEDDDDVVSEITEQNLRLPGHKGKKKKAIIQVVDQQGA